MQTSPGSFSQGGGNPAPAQQIPANGPTSSNLRHMPTPEGQNPRIQGGPKAAPQDGQSQNWDQVAQELSTTKQQLAEAQKMLQQTQQTSTENAGMMQKLKSLFTGDQEPQLAPHEQTKQEMDAFLDQYLTAEMEAQRQGSGMPLTTNMAAKLANHVTQQAQTNQQLQQQVQQLQQQLQVLSDPQMNVDNNAYMQIDNAFRQGFDKVYGPGEQNYIQKQAMFNAATQQASNMIKQMKETNPQQWDMLRRNPGAIEQFATNMIMDYIPPEAKRILSENHVKNTDMTPQELMTAYREAGQVQDPKQRTRIRNQIRQQYLSQTVGDRFNQQGPVNQWHANTK